MIEYTIIKSKRRTLTMSVDKNNIVVVKAPLNLSDSKIEDFVKRHVKWIKKIQLRNENRIIKDLEGLSSKEIDNMKKKTYDLVIPKIDTYSKKMGVRFSKVSITSANQRFGSCSKSGHLCFSYRLWLYPEECVDYVIYHELCHLVYMNHSKEFYNLLASYYPNYKSAEKLLKSL